MPRRRPGRVRAELPLRRQPRDDHQPAVPGLSGPARAEIARIERRRNYLWPGATVTAVRLWGTFVHRPHHRIRLDDDGGGCGVWECCGDPFQARDCLEGVMLAMTRRGRRELRALIDRLDDLY